MSENIEKEPFFVFQKQLSNCVNTHCKIYRDKELILSFSPIKKQIGFIEYGKAMIIKTDEEGNTTILRDLNKNDIFSNLFFQDSEDEIYVISNGEAKIIFIDYYTIIRNCSRGCPFHNSLVFFLYELLIQDNKKQNEKIELLSKRTVREKIEFFLKHRMNEKNIFKVTTSYKEIAEYIAVDRSNFMRELKKMEEKNCIKREGKEITILK